MHALDQSMLRAYETCCQNDYVPYSGFIEKQLNSIEMQHRLARRLVDSAPKGSVYIDYKLMDHLVNVGGKYDEYVREMNELLVKQLEAGK